MSDPRGGTYWERRRAGALPWVLGAVGLLGLGTAFDVPLRHSVEDDLRTRSQEALAAAGATGVDVTFTGRDGVLTGALPSGMTEQDVIEAVEAVEGVRVARVDLGGSAAAGPDGAATPSPSASATTSPSSSATTSPSSSATTSPSSQPSSQPSSSSPSGSSPSGSSPSGSSPASSSPGEAAAQTPPTVTAATSNGSVVLTGSVPSREAADALVEAATARFGQGRVTDRLTVSGAVSDAGLTGMGALLGVLQPRDEVTAALAEGRMTLSGSVAAEQTRAALEQAAAGVTGNASGVTSDVEVGSAADRAREAVEARLNGPQITFATGSIRLTPQGRRAVSQVAAILRANPETLVRIEGFTDDIGATQANQRLSTARASAVRDALYRHGIAHERMSYRGYGESRPLVPNTSAENRAKNRRVHFLVLQP